MGYSKKKKKNVLPSAILRPMSAENCSARTFLSENNNQCLIIDWKIYFLIKMKLSEKKFLSWICVRWKESINKFPRLIYNYESQDFFLKIVIWTVIKKIVKNKRINKSIGISDCFLHSGICYFLKNRFSFEKLTKKRTRHVGGRVSLAQKSVFQTTWKIDTYFFVT